MQTNWLAGCDLGWGFIYVKFLITEATVLLVTPFSQFTFYSFLTAEIYPKVYHICFFIVTYFAPLCLMVLAYIQICHKLWFQQVCTPDLHVLVYRTLQSHLLNCTDVSFWYLINRFLEARQCFRGSGGQCSAQPPLQGQESQWESGPAQFVLRSNRSEPAARQLVCWWWFSLFLPCATCQSAYSMSWKGNLSCPAASRIKNPLNTECSTKGASAMQGSHLHVQ